MSDKHKLAFGRKNYIIMLAGIGLIILGFIIMTLDNNTFGFGFLGITLGPIFVVLGFIVEIFAILQKPQHKE